METDQMDEAKMSRRRRKALYIVMNASLTKARQTDKRIVLEARRAIEAATKKSETA
jgi:hypothetical protein